MLILVLKRHYQVVSVLMPTLVFSNPSIGSEFSASVTASAIELQLELDVTVRKVKLVKRHDKYYVRSSWSPY